MTIDERRMRGCTAACCLMLLATLAACGDAEQRAVDAPADASSGDDTGLVIAGTPPGGLEDWVEDIRTGLADVPMAVERADAEGSDGAGRESPQVEGQVLELYLSRQEYIERYYGAGGPRAGGRALDAAVHSAEARFHDVMRAVGESPPDSGTVRRAIELLGIRLEQVLEEARAAGVPIGPPTQTETDAATVSRGPGRGDLAERVQETVQLLTAAEEAYEAGDALRALRLVERAYLEGFEPLEARLPLAAVGRVERLVHIRLRPQIAAGAPESDVRGSFAELSTELLALESSMSPDSRFWFGAFNAFIIIVREGLEAVLLIAAILAYLKRVSEEPKHRRQIYAGAALGLIGSLATWGLAQRVISIGGASRELVEGVTALVAVAVLLYVSHWLFHKAYVIDWMEYLRERVGRAVTAGSALAMAALAFAAVYREGFETVLFYQALLFDVGPGAVLAGFLPGLLLITGVGVGIVRLGLLLPLRRVFGVTNAILLYLGFVFLGKGIYNIQEAGLFAPHPISWFPDHPLLRQLFGLYPLVETVLAQAAFLALLGLTFLYYWLRLVARKPSGTVSVSRTAA